MHLFNEKEERFKENFLEESLNKLMKSKDQTLLEEAYKNITEGILDKFFNPQEAEEDSEHHPEDQVPSRIESIHVRNFWNTFKKYEKGEVSRQQWGDVCIEILTEIMEKNRDILARLKY